MDLKPIVFFVTLCFNFPNLRLISWYRILRYLRSNILVDRYLLLSQNMACCNWQIFSKVIQLFK